MIDILFAGATGSFMVAVLADFFILTSPPVASDWRRRLGNVCCSLGFLLMSCAVWIWSVTP